MAFLKDENISYSNYPTSEVNMQKIMKKYDINKWKSCAVDIDSYHIIRAMGQKGFRRPGSMIAKLVDDEIKKIAKKCLS